MKKLAVMVLCLVSISALGLDDESVSQMLNDAVGAEGKDYIVARDKITNHGESVLPLLAKAAIDENADWRYRLAARICYERIVLDSGISAIRAKDWIALAWGKCEPSPGPKEDVIRPDGKSIIDLTPPAGTRMAPLIGLYTLISDDFVEDLERLGAWYYCIELSWKQTNEVTTVPGSHLYDDGKFPAAWSGLCAHAIRKQPENIWLYRVLAEQIKSADFTKIETRYIYERIYSMLVEGRDPECVKVLIDRFDDFMNSDIGFMKGTPRFTELSQYKFIRIMSFADNRHVALFEEFITNRPVYEPLRPRIEEIRSRPAPPQPDPREAFRLLDRQPIINDAQTLTLPTP